MHRLIFPALLLLAALCTGAYVIHERAEQAEQPGLLSRDIRSESLTWTGEELQRLPAPRESSGDFQLVGHEEEVERLPHAEDAFEKENPLRQSEPADFTVDEESENAEGEQVRHVAPPLELRSALDRKAQTKPALAPETIRRRSTIVDNSRVAPASARPPAEHRFSGVKDFNAPSEADPNWVVDQNEPVVARESLLHLQLPHQVKIRTRAMLDEATVMADRGALYAARNQFLRIIRMTTQSLDAQLGRPIHTKALARGLRALDEADDFALSGDSAESDLQIIGFIAGHRTPVLKSANPDNVTSLIAMQRYYKYAYEQLSLAGNNEASAAEALFSLGRVEALLAEAKGNARGGGPKALALFHAALTVNPNHGRAANELGVMLAQRGRMPEARNVLMKATATSSNPSAMRNLAVVQQYLGDPTSSSTARRAEMMAARARVPKVGNNTVQFVDAATFNTNGATSTTLPKNAAMPARMNPTPTPAPQVVQSRPTPGPRVALTPPAPTPAQLTTPVAPPRQVIGATPVPAPVAQAPVATGTVPAKPKTRSLASPFLKLPSRNRPAPRPPVRTANRTGTGSWDF